MPPAYDRESGLRTTLEDDPLPERLDLLRRLGLGMPDSAFDQLASDLARDADMPYAMVNLMMGEQTFVGLHTPLPGSGLPEVGRTMDRAHGFCPDVVDRRKALPLPDVLASPLFSGNPVVDRIGIRSYYGAPLIHSTGMVLGTVCVVGTEPREMATADASLEVIKHYRDLAMDLIEQRTRHT